MKNTKTKLISSVAVMLICFAMLIGSTFAWFTDSASTGVNKIQAGTLKIGFEMKNATGDWVDAERETLAWKKASGALPGEATLWEPGVTYELPLLKITNLGNLETQFKVLINGVTGTDKNEQPSTKLLDALNFEITYVQAEGDFDLFTNDEELAAITSSFRGSSLNNLPYTIARPSYYNEQGLTGIRLRKNGSGADTYYVRIRAHMDKSANNDYQGLSLNNIGITVVATQLPEEYDSFNNTYDKDAEYPNVAAAYVTTSNGEVSSPVTVSTATKNADGNPIATVTIPEGVKVTTNNLVLKIEEVATPSNASVAVTSNSKTLEVKLDGLDAGNEKPIKVESYIEAGLGNNVALKHISSNGTITPFTKVSSAVDVNDNQFYYDNNTGLLTFMSKSFSPFVLEYPKDTWTNHLEGYETNSDSVAVINTAGQLAKFANDVSTSSVSAGHKAVINNDLDMSKYLWNPITVNGYTGEGIVTIEGKDHTIKNMNGPLFSGGFAGISGIVINNLTLDGSILDGTFADQGLGAFICSVDSMPKIELNNCHLKNSTITSTGDVRVGGLIGWTSGYNNQNDGPVDTHITITNCSVVDCNITANGSAGAIIGHAGSNPATYHTITNCTVTGTTLNSTDDGDWRVGVIVGTANVGEVTISGTTESGNTLTQTGKTAPSHSNLYGRFVPGTDPKTGKLNIDNIEITE